MFIDWFASLNFWEVVAWNSFVASLSLTLLLVYLAQKMDYRPSERELLKPRSFPIVVGFGLGMSCAWLLLGWWMEEGLLRSAISFSLGLGGGGLAAWLTYHFKEIVNKLP